MKNQGEAGRSREKQGKPWKIMENHVEEGRSREQQGEALRILDNRGEIIFRILVAVNNCIARG